jgi:hypothetical protein
MGPEYFARPSSLLVDPGISVPHKSHLPRPVSRVAQRPLRACSPRAQPPPQGPPGARGPPGPPSRPRIPAQRPSPARVPPTRRPFRGPARRAPARSPRSCVRARQLLPPPCLASLCPGRPTHACAARPAAPFCRACRARGRLPNAAAAVGPTCHLSFPSSLPASPRCTLLGLHSLVFTQSRPHAAVAAPEKTTSTARSRLLYGCPSEFPRSSYPCPCALGQPRR